MNRKNLIIVAVVLIIASGASFYAGVLHARSGTGARAVRTAGGFGGAGATGATQRGRLGNAAVGEIIAKDEQSVTVKLPSGGSRIVFFGASTMVGKMVAGNLDDLVLGENIVAAGSNNSDGSITANSIQIRPASTTETFFAAGARPR